MLWKKREQREQARTQHDTSVPEKTSKIFSRPPDAEKTPDPCSAEQLTRDHVIWAYRILLDRDPESDDVIGPKLAGSRNTGELRRHLMTSAEFRTKNPDYAHANDSTVVIKELETGGETVRLFVDLSDHVIGLGILRGQYEADEIAFVRSVLKPGDTAIDVGAHIGFFTIQMAAWVGPTGAVHAFEPYHPNAVLLERSILENRFADRITFTRAAVAASSGAATLTFPLETLNSGGAYVLRGGAAPLPGNLTTSVPAVALDDVDVRRPVRLIKLDVEGAEPLVVRGARRLLAADRPIILSELHPTQLARASGMSGRDFLRELESAGYRAHHLERGRVGTRLDAVPDEITSVALVPV
jgi:FkbM family methyltransferase